jgi:hypothetical protein
LGTPCINGHIAERYTSDWKCAECRRLKNTAIDPPPNGTNTKRWEAKKAGLKHFFTGIPCQHGHIAKRYVCSGACYECARLQAWEWAQDRERCRILERKRYRNRKLTEDDPHWARDKQRRRMEKKAGRPRPDRCEICNQLAVTQFDHCHVTQKFRGWLCRRCNSILGLVDDQTALLKALISYLEQTNGTL